MTNRNLQFKCFTFVIILISLLALTGCTSLEKNARDTAAVAQGLIVAAQAKYLTTCQAKPTQTVCVDINKAVAAQNILITSIETYCGWSTISPPSDPNTACVPVKTAATALQSAINNLGPFITELKGVLQ